jgi:fibro-slime domain-containing protein
LAQPTASGANPAPANTTGLMINDDGTATVTTDTGDVVTVDVVMNADGTTKLVTDDGSEILVDPSTDDILATEPSGTPNCGDGVLTDDEACDDGNTASDDGCAGDCLTITSGYSCAIPGQPCRPIARCGDGLVAASEQCDDGNAASGDGCSERCKVELGSQCSGEPSVCIPAECGNGVVEGAEACDDGNTTPFDGCSSLCLREPDCSGPSCTSDCGDGLVINEECDDGNNIDGDGCSKDCTIEDGFMCTRETACERVNGECILRVPVIFRDMSGDKTTGHPDFQQGNCSALTLGVVQDQLDAEGRPVLADGRQACIQSADSFAQWYRDGSYDVTVIGSIVLWDNGMGGYVNRWGANGEKFTAWTQQGTINEQPINAMTDCTTEVCHPCSYDQTIDCFGGTLLEFDGNPLFFPLDDITGPTADMDRAKVPAEYGYDAWPWEDEVFPGAPLHNFYFTSEVLYWFSYDADTNATLDFTGDDDVWVFVNGHLAVDLGGLHTPKSGSVTIDAQSAAGFGLAAGNVYRIAVFHAERKKEGSSFKLTLSGFEATPSDCRAVCGDGVLSFGEECDDGENDGGYGECDPGCVLGEFCGDGIVNGPEDCDNGPGGGPGCPNCRKLVAR